MNHRIYEYWKLLKAIKSIASYTAELKPKTLREAEGMLAVIEVIARETLAEVEAMAAPS